MFKARNKLGEDMALVMRTFAYSENLPEMLKQQATLEKQIGKQRVLAAVEGLIKNGLLRKKQETFTYSVTELYKYKTSRVEISK